MDFFFENSDFRRQFQIVNENLHFWRKFRSLKFFIFCEKSEFLMKIWIFDKNNGILVENFKYTFR